MSSSSSSSSSTPSLPLSSNEYWKRFGGELVDFDDGHRPENLKDTATKLVVYPKLLLEPQRKSPPLPPLPSPPPQVHVYSNALPEHLVDQVYEKTAQSSRPSWGDYVTIERVQDYWRINHNNNNNNNNTTTSSENKEDDDSDLLIVQLVAHYLKLALGENKESPPRCFGGKNDDDNDDNDKTNAGPLWNRQDLSRAHGVGIWALAATPGSRVPYHLDYAELIRYEYNIIVPPMLAGTLQCTRAPVIGGDFVVSLDGISHYQQHGYKSKTKELNYHTTTGSSTTTSSSSSWITIPYRFNQLTCHLGNLPHASTKVDSIEGDDQEFRVIVGFNVFGHDVGPLVQQAPEHSDAFRRKVQAQRILLSSCQNANCNNTNTPKQLSLDALKQNKPLSKLLVLAKRERIKQEFQKAKDRLAQEIPPLLPSTVQDLMNKFHDPTSRFWPASQVDVQVYLNQQIQRCHYRIIADDGETSSQLVSPTATIDIVQ